MTTEIEGFPKELVSANVADAAVTLTVDASAYPLEALYGAAYVFIDRCYVLLDKPDDKRFVVTLASKQPTAGADALRAMCGEFANELLSCAWRHQISKDNRAVIEAITLEAISGAMGAPTLDDLAAFDFAEEPFEDPLGIAMSWEDKYAKKKEGADASAPDAAADKPADKPAEKPAEKPAGEGEKR